MTPATRVVLVVEDKQSVLALLVRYLTSVDCTVLTATSLTEAVRIADRTPRHVIVLDLRLPDASERETLEAVLRHHLRSLVVVVSAFLTTELTVLAMKWGAFHVFEKPLDANAFLDVIRNALATATEAGTHLVRSAARAGDAVSRLVEHIVRALTADGDLKTLGAWAEHIGVSLTMLRQACYLAHVPAHEARDFVRALVAVVRGRRLGCECDLLLDIADTRTRDTFLARAGLAGRTTVATVEEFLDRQQFIPSGHEVLRLLREALKR